MGNTLQRPPLRQPLVDKDGYVARGWAPFFQGLFQQAATLTQALNTAQAAAPGSAEVVAISGLHGGGAVGENTALRLYIEVCGVAVLPASASEGDLAYATDGRRVGQSAGAGTGVPVWYSGGAWYAIDSGSAVAA